MMKRRLLSLTMALALCLGLLPTTAFALDGDKTIMLGTSGIKDPTAEGNTYYTPNSYIYFGVNESEPIKWRVLDADKANNGTTSGMFLLSEYLLGDTQFDDSSNVWQGSDTQKWCTDFASNSSNFSTAEQSAMQGIAKEDSSETLYSVPWGASSLTEQDKMFFLSARELTDYVGDYDGAPGLSATDTEQIAGYWWLRSPYAYLTSYAGLVIDIGDVYFRNVPYDWAARPAFNLNLNSVLFTSAAEGGKSTAAASGGNQGGVGADAIFEINDTDTNEWKLTLLDDNHKNFSISDAKKENNTVSFSYNNAQTGTNEYISVVIEDKGEITHYGRILKLDDTTNGANGRASLALPEGVTLDENTKLYVFNEQYNGDKMTDYASLLWEFDTTAPTLSNGSATRTGETTATVKFISDEAGEYFYEVVESGTTAPTINTAGTGTSCASGENTISLTSLSDAGAKDIYIVAKDAVGNVSETLKITIPAPVYEISADTESWDFGTVTEGYTQAPAAKTVTITNTGNQDVTVDLPTSTNYIITAGTGFTSGNAALSPDGEAQFTVQPKTGLGVGTYQETLEMTGTYSVSDDVELHFVVEQRPTGGGGSSRPTPTISQQIITKIKTAQDGDVVTADLPAGKTVLDKEVFEELAGRDVTLVLNLEEEVSWSIYGLDVPETGNFADTDMGVSMNAGSVPVDIINAITGEVDTMQMTLAHDGEFGFTLTLTAPLGSKNAGYWANLYYYDEDAESLTFQTSAQIGEDGTAALRFTHASQYVIIIDDRDHTPKEFPFVDVEESDWYYEAVDYVFQRDLMNGTDSTHFTPDGTSSRAMVATILWRMAGEPQVNYAMDFADVSSGTWYTEAVRWAASEGIVTGYSDTKFGPDDPVTREQFAVMLYRYAQTLGEGFTGSWSFPLNFPDAAEVSDYAYEALCWMTMENVIQGMEDGGLHPQGTANRAQLATMLMRFCQSVDL